MENDLQPDTSANSLEIEDKATGQRRRSSTSRFTRDLLPASRGISRPGSHSVFNTLILDDDPLDGSRSLRKRKATSEQPDQPDKRPRTQDSRTSNPERSPERILADKIETLNSNASKASAPSSVEGRSTRSSKTPKHRHSEVPEEERAKILKRSHRVLVLSLRLPTAKLKAIAQSKKKRERPRPTMSTLQERPASSHVAPFYAFHERENDDLKSKPYGGILSEADANTERTVPSQIDRLNFNKARERAEEERRERAALSEAEQDSKARLPKLSGPPSKIKAVYFGGYEIETWYAAPYPEEYSRNRLLYLCEFCLKYMASDYVAWKHKSKCPAKHPPGDEIYRDGSVSIFEVDGRKNPVYCQNLCLLAKLFLGSKTLYYDVEPFLFYVMTEYDYHGCHFVGYFSKEKRPSSLNNVSCILTLPTHQRKGYGNLLISFSYLLTRVEGKTGSPEKPLSDMGLVSYRNYWRLVLSYELRNQIGPISITELSNRTGMTADDIIAALEGLRALVRDPITKSYALRLDYEYFEKCIADWEAKRYVTMNPDLLVWTPYIMGRSNRAHYETAPALPTIAPREDEEEENAVPAEEGVQAAAQAAASQENESAIIDDNVPTLQTAMKPNGIITSGDDAQLASQLASSLPKPTTSSPNKVNGRTPQRTPSVPEAPIIPPTRYEIYPRIPGLVMRSAKVKRGGWRGGTNPQKKKDVMGTPLANTTPTIGAVTRRTKPPPPLETPDATRVNSGSGSSSISSSTRRRTRANPGLENAQFDGAGDERLGDAEEGGEEDAEGEEEDDAVMLDTVEIGERDEEYEGGEDDEEDDEEGEGEEESEDD